MNGANPESAHDTESKEAHEASKFKYNMPVEKWPTLNDVQKMGAKDLVKKKQWEAEEAE